MSAAVTLSPETRPVNYSTLKKIADSGVQYQHALGETSAPTAPMSLGSAVHAMTLGQRPDQPVVCFHGRRAGKAWEAFEAEHAGATILNEAEWEKAAAISAAVLADPIAREYMARARFEVPLTWDDGGVLCGTSGIDIVQPNRIGDLKTARTTHIDSFQRQAFGFGYHCQLAWYRRGARANGFDVSGGLFVVAVETVAPYEVVVHEMSEDLIDLGERTISLWLEKYRTYSESNQWPGRAQSAVVWTVPSWMQDEDDDDE